MTKPTEHEPHPDLLQGEYPGWYAWPGIAGLVYARLMLSSPPVVLRAHNLTVLRLRVGEWELRRRLRLGLDIAAPGGGMSTGREPEP